MQQAAGADRLPGPSEAHQATHQQTSQTLHKPESCSWAHMPLASEHSSGTPLKPYIPCVEGHNLLLDHVVMRDILRVLGDSRPPNLYACLQKQYLQHIPRFQAEQQGCLLVYLQWLTQRLIQHESAGQHKQLYAAVLKMSKVSLQVMLSAPQLPVHLQSVLHTIAFCGLWVCSRQHANIQRPYRDAQNKPAWRDRTWPTHT